MNPNPSSALAAVAHKTLVRVIVVAVIIVSGVACMQVLQAALDLRFTKTPMPLKQPLPLLSKELGTPARYTAQGYDSVMDEETLEVLGTREYLLRTYYDKRKLETDPTAYLSLNLNYYATGDANPHVPEICWAGRGLIEAQCSRRIFDIPNVRRADGSIVNLQARLISFVPPGETEDPKKLRNVAYLFNVNGEYVAMPQEVTSRFWKASNEYAFDTKLEVTVGRERDFCSQDEAIAAVREFFQTGLANIEECLPDMPKPKVEAAAESAKDGGIIGTHPSK